MSADFTSEQKRYLEGFAAGLGAMKATGGFATGAAPAASPPSGPDAEHIAAQDRTLASGKKLVDQEKWKRAEHPFDAYARLASDVAKGDLPKPEDNFRWRYFGLFNVAPAQNSFMCRLRIPNGILTWYQMQGLAALTDRYAGGYSHVTTRANLQIREIAPENGPPLLEGLCDLGLTAKGAGADNIRNVTGTPTAGIDPIELLDTRPYARAWHFHILNDRSLYGLPRKFNVAFDGAGSLAVLEETNDIAFQAVEVREGAGLQPGVWFRLALGGITGHRDLARDTGVVVRPADAVAVADAIIRVFIDHGDRTNRNKARMKYVLDAWGFDRYLKAVEEKLGRPLDRVAAAHVLPRAPIDRMGHIGVHPQRQPGLNWVGVLTPVGRMTTDQMREVAAVARDLGDGDIRLTVWQNLLISGVHDAAIEAAVLRLKAVGLSCEASHVRAGMVACTGNTGCKFAASNTKGTAALIADHCDRVLTLDQPINIHLTGCHHSCAQHYIGDIGLIAAKVPINDEGDSAEGFDIVVGGGYGDQAKIGQEIFKGIRSEDCPATVERLLRAYLAHRATPDEPFFAFANRTPVADLKRLAEEAAP